MNTPTSTSDTTQYQPCIDERCYRLGRALRAGRLEPDSWGFNFTRSILKQNKRRDWMPSERQLSVMQKLVAELAEPDEDLIDDGGDND